MKNCNLNFIYCSKTGEYILYTKNMLKIKLCIVPQSITNYYHWVIHQQTDGVTLTRLKEGFLILDLASENCQLGQASLLFKGNQVFH